MDNCLWCHGEDDDEREWAVCDLRFRPKVSLTDYICAACATGWRKEEFQEFQTEVFALCEGAYMALSCLDQQNDEQTLESIEADIKDYLLQTPDNKTRYEFLDSIGYFSG